MRLTAILLLGVCLHVSAGTMSQQVTLTEKNVPLQTVFKKIKEQTGYTFVYRNDWLQQAQPVTIDVQGASLSTALALCFKDQPFTYETIRNTIVLRRKELPPVIAAEVAMPPPVKGKVVDEKGAPIVGASVVVRGTKIGVVTKADGSFEIDAGTEGATLVISYVGFVAKTVKVKDGQLLAIILATADINMQDMVVTGIVNRRRESFTGASVSFSNTQLKAIGNQNVIQSLRSLDPSFILTENNVLGSNPNQLPQIEIRGKTSISSRALQNEFAADPNQPLFIMDGFETTLRAVLDLDINRIENVTLLKDAASTAIYGARAANGVVVIETRRPKSGAMQLYYNGDFKLEMPDLTGYNLMDGAEKLEFERLSGRYRIYSESLIEEQLYLDSLYSSRLERVRRGVNTYWINEPVQLGFSQGHSVRAEGGDNIISYAAGLQYKISDGVLKGSGRKTWQGNIDLTYRKNRVNILNKFFVNGFTANESPYGSFANFARANPYYAKYNEGGGVDKYLEISSRRDLRTERIPNPLYNALLNNFDETRNFSFQNNLAINYQLSPDMDIRGAIQLQKGSGEQSVFLAPDHSNFDDVGLFERGSHTNKRLNSFSYQANAMLTYGRVFNGLHQVSGNARVEVQEEQNDAYSSKVVGFPPGTNGNPAFAYSYNPNDQPSTSYRQFRRNNFLVSGSYTYDRRYVVDFSYRMDGSTAFGSNKKYSPFWSVGAAWNLHNEAAFRDKKWISLLRLKVNTGATGNQNFDQVTSVSVYSYEPTLNLFGQGLTLATLGNPNLAWQNTLQTNVGAEFSLFKGRFGGFINVFQKYTDPLIVSLDLPSSTGLYGYPKNVGTLNNKGIEVNLNFKPINRPNTMVWTIGVTGIIQKAIYSGLANELKGLDKSEELANSLRRYRDGYSPEDMWAVYSLGIDPGTGREMFLKQDGTVTYDYDAKDLRVVGSERPFAEGVINSSFMWKGFSAGITIRYRVGGDVRNEALYNKVENISDDNVFYNQDRRALYDRWKKAGDVARFKAISITSTTPISSRFIQEENTISGESIRVGYDFARAAFLKKLGMRSLTLTGYLNDVFRISTVKNERGISYPFARTMAFSISTSF
ncbi:SusC/RagA family TonB-linked outer membrane protein [Paraflavitalea sp. CAU 1676]|uniref:SusC/RagA family TonB-linked outer membrane protein n=1 Tax=Paraflavitalea sp. CAU 1676 TaxID=3032598 RepID=UPI0023DB1F99|nr:SusC/RagA family TonB-linked outer membrane protein [Paraflavitalea sp. CAU 1676]MDF2192826.1 SusC/RagA family TonB-linked outer membrane protein [Paraflavitalea sp. CAU 1676]